MAPSFFDTWIYPLLYLAYVVTLIGTVLVVISENRNPVKTIAWVVVLFLLPVVGLVFYFFFGQSYTKIKMISRRAFKKIQRITEREEPDFSVYKFSENVQQIIKLAYSLKKATFYPGNKISFFYSGKTKFDQLLIDMQQATHHIHIQYYIFMEGEIGNKIKALLIQKVQEGVEVRLMYDDVGSWKTKAKFFKPMIDAGIEVRPFYKVSFPSLANKINYRNHRKLVIIDGKIGYIGGMNVADRYIDGVKWGVWRDTHLKIEGPAVYGLQSSFAIDWHFAGSPLLATNDYFPLIESQGNVPMQIMTSGPLGEWHELLIMYIKAISNAKEYVYIQTPYFLPNDALLTVLQVAALAKVDVRIMLPAKSDSVLLDRATSSYIKEVLVAGIKVYRYTAGFLHAKSIVADDELLYIGSTNVDFRSFEHNFEINAMIYDRVAAQMAKKQFLIDIESSERTLLKQWVKRPRKRKMVESIVRLMSPLL